MNIQEGKYYIARNDELVGPMEVNDFNKERPPFSDKNFGWYDGDGTHGYEDVHATSCDIIDTVDNAARKHVEGN